MITSNIEKLEGIDDRVQFVFHLLPPPLIGPCGQSVELTCQYQCDSQLKLKSRIFLTERNLIFQCYRKLIV